MSSKTGDTSHMNFLSLPVSPAAQYSTGGLPQVPGLESVEKSEESPMSPNSNDRPDHFSPSTLEPYLRISKERK